MRFKYGSIALLLFVFAGSCAKEEPILKTEEVYHQELDDLLNTFKAETGIVIYYEASNDAEQKNLEIMHGINSDVYYKGEKKYQLLQYWIEGLIDVLNAYPKTFMAKADLKSVFIVNSGSLSYSGIANLSKRSIAINRLHNAGYKETLAHELFHLFDPAPAQSVWTTEQQQFDMTWQSFNPPGFVYGDGCGLENTIKTYTQGFITDYCRCNSTEDRAVTFQMLVFHSDMLLGKTINDSYLESKVNFIRDLVNQYGYNL